MKIGETQNRSAIQKVAKTKRVGAADRAQVDSSAERQISDSISIMGVPEAELTPKVRAALTQLMSEVSSLKTELESLRRRTAELETLADQDPLLPIFNRRAFVKEIARALAYTDRYGEASSLLYFDLDNFKSVNDSFGHAAGDAALHHVGALLQQSIRGSDVVGRLGGDEFGIVLTNAARKDAELKAESLRKSIEENVFVWQGEQIKLSASFGVMELVRGQSVEDALNAADQAMYDRKKRPDGDGV